MIEAIKDNWWYIAPDIPEEPIPEPNLAWRGLSPYCVVETTPGYTTCQGLDVAIILDVTGSMENSIVNVRNSLSTIVNNINNKYDDYRISLIAVTDNIHTEEAPRYSDNYAEVLTNFSLNNQSQVQAALSNISAYGGGNTAEPHDLALQSVLHGGVGTFRDKVTKMVFIITDAPNSGFDDNHTSKDIAFIQGLSSEAAKKNIKIFPIIIKGGSRESQAMSAANTYVGNTGGKRFVSDNGHDVATHMITAIGDIKCEVIPDATKATGYRAFSVLEQYDVDTGIATGITKSNDPGTEGYILPVKDEGTCPTNTLEISPPYVFVIPDGEVVDISIVSDAPWTASKNVSWIYLSQSSGTGNATIQAHVMKNTGGPRMGLITVASGGLTKTCGISQ